jgi:23S rRNA (adenine2503-C2)-methyltransferase
MQTTPNTNSLATPQPDGHEGRAQNRELRLNLLGLSRSAVAAALEQCGVAKKQVRMRVGQIWHWIYFRGAQDFAQMTNISKELRTVLDGHFSIVRPSVAQAQLSSDGTRKWLLKLADGTLVETVFIPEEDRGTLCVSSQVGCTLNCTFCHTGTQKLVRNLTAGEIIGQIMIARDSLGEWPATPEERQITNVVLMGMGEPLYNFDNVKEFVKIATDNEGLSISKRRITLSTAGVVPMIARVGQEIGCMLAISLHATNNETRNRVVPLNKKYPLEELLQACRSYPDLKNAKRITFEYVMLKGVNDSEADARELVRILQGIPAKVNLIPFNPWPGAPYECSDWEAIERFGDIVNRGGYASPIRTPRGRDIMAACGQLKSASIKEHARLRRPPA